MSKGELFSKLFREAEVEIGTSSLDVLVLDSLRDTIKNCRIANGDEFCEQFDELIKLVSNTEPKFGIVIYHLAQLHNLYCEDLKKRGIFWKRHAIKYIKDLLRDVKNNKLNILKNSEKLKVNGKTILIHDHSHTVQDVLIHLKRKRKSFRVIIAEQDFEKTHANIEVLHANKIPFQVVPAYMLSHIHDNVDMLFFGAVTLKDEMKFVMDPGTHGVISEFHLAGKPSYMFLDTTKFSLWRSKKRKDGIFKHTHERMHHSKPIKYERIKYSHDRVDIELFDKIVTEEGIFSPEQIQDLFKERMKLI